MPRPEGWHPHRNTDGGTIARAAFDAKGDVVVVTGGAHGIGRALASAVAGAGGQAVVFDVDISEPSTDGIDFVRVDVSDRDAVAAAVHGVESRHGSVTGLVAGAAVQPRIGIAETTPDIWHRTLAVNLDGVLWACQAVLPGCETGTPAPS